MTLMEKFYAKLSSIRKIPELRDRIIFTLIMFLVARVGTYIPAPGIDVDRLATMTAQSDILGYINMFSGGAFKRVSIFALGIVPYINASIVFSLLAVIIPKIEEIQKDGEAGRNKINQWTRYLTIAIAIVQGFGVCMWLQSVGLVTTPGILFFLTTVVTLTAGTVFLMWIGEQISIKGIGNGVSLLIFLNVISGGPSSVVQTIQTMKGSKFLIPVLILIAGAAVPKPLRMRWACSSPSGLTVIMWVDNCALLALALNHAAVLASGPDVQRTGKEDSPLGTWEKTDKGIAVKARKNKVFNIKG